MQEEVNQGASGPSKINMRKPKEFSKDLWALVLGRFEDVRDFARLELVSKSLQDLVLQNCWTKVKKIYIYTILTIGTEKWLRVTVDTGLLWQELQLPVNQAAQLLENLVQKTKKITSVRLNLHWMVEDKYDQIVRQFLDALVDAEVKVKQLEISNMILELHQTTAPKALARFLKANSPFLTTLEVRNVYALEGALPEELLVAFKACHALEKVEIFRSDHLVDSILEDKSQLKSLAFDSYGPLSTFVKCGAMLRHFCCKMPYTLQAFQTEVEHQNQNNHPLISIQALEVESSRMMTTLPWNLFPNLELLVCENFWIEHLLELVKSCLTQWVGLGKPLECRLVQQSTSPASSEEVAKCAAAVELAWGCRVTINIGHNGARDGLKFRKGCITFKLLMPEEMD